MMDRKAVPFAAASLRGGAARHPVTLDVPVRIRAEAHQAHPAFIEDTRTALVFSRGAVVPVGEPLDIGQSVLLTHRRTRQEIPCRVVYSKNQPGPGVKGYVELEFLRPAPNFWEIQFPYDDAMQAAAAPRSGAAVVNVPAPRASSAAPQVSDAPENVVALADAVMPARPTPGALPLFGYEFAGSPVASSVIGNVPLVEDIETLLDRKAAANAAAEPAEAFTFHLPLDENEVFTAAPPRRAFGSGAKLAAVAAGIAIVSLGAWQIVAGPEASGRGSSEAEAQISLAEAPALRTPSVPEMKVPEIKFEPQQAAPTQPSAAVENAAAPAAASVGTSAPPASAPAPAVEQGHSAPVPFARAKAEEAARIADQLTMKSDSLVEARPLVRVMMPALPSKLRVESAPPDAGVAPSVPASFSVAPIANLATKSSPPPIQGGRAVPPKLLATARLMYPVLAKKSNIQGDVVIDALVDTKGRVSDMKVASGHAMLHQAALESVAQWRYDPGMLNGQPVEVRTTIVVKFRLGGQ